MSPKAIFISGGILLGAAILLLGFRDAATPTQIYSPANGFKIERRRDADNNDRVIIHATTTKLENCDLESGDGPPWVEFFDDQKGSVTPTGSLYRPDGSPSGNTRGDKGAVLRMDGYSTIAPNKLRTKGGSFTLKIPCQLWVYDAAKKEKVYGDQVVGEWGPVPIPLPGRFIVQAPIEEASGH